MFDYNIRNSLGYVNISMGRLWAGPPSMTPKNYGYLNAPDPTRPAPSHSPGSPGTTGRTSARWKCCSCRRLPLRADAPVLHYAHHGPGPDDPDGGPPPPGFNAPFGHLFNFFFVGWHQDRRQEIDELVPRAGLFVHVPSRFVGTETWLPPAPFQPVLPSAGGLTEQQLASFYHPPFNRVSNYREPGKVNINTVAGYAGVRLATAESRLERDSQRHSGTDLAAIGGQPPRRCCTDQERDEFDPAKPSLFAQPFRSVVGGAYRLPGTMPGLAPGVLPKEIEASWMRPMPSPTLSSPIPLFSALNAGRPQRLCRHRSAPLLPLSELAA